MINPFKRKPQYTLDEVYKQTEVISMLQKQADKTAGQSPENYRLSQSNIVIAQKVLERMLETMEGK